MVEHQLFEYEANKPVGFFLHSSIKNKFQQENLRIKITNYGGKVLDSPSGANIVLVDETRIKSVQFEQVRYSMSDDEKLRSVVVEPMNFIQICIKTGRLVHTAQKLIGMGGRPAGSRRRNEFTAQEDDYMCRYVATRIPDPLSGGRLSRGVFLELVELGQEDPDYAWATRHTAHSWLERYRKNRARFDPIIQKYAEEFPPPPSALYKYSRRANKNQKWLIEAQVIEITDGSEDDSSFEEPAYSRPPKSSKRARIDTNSPSPTEEPVEIEAQRRPSSSGDAPDLTFDPFEPQTPAPSPTLVNKASQRFGEPASNQAVRSPILPRPSTSFRDVVHSSPALHSRLPGGDTMSTNTTITEPSSRSLAVLSGLSHPPQNTTNQPAESSILRESAHKRASPVPAPVRKAARRPKVSIQPPASPPSNDVVQGSTWAPYRNTRSRSRSVEPAPLPAIRKKSGRKDPVRRNGKPLEPVFEGEIEHERHEEEEEEEEEEKSVTKQVADSREKNQKVRTMTETMQEEYDVEDLLMAQSHGAISGVVSGAWHKETEVEEQEDDVEENLVSDNGPHRQQQPLFMFDSDDDAMDQMMSSPQYPMTEDNGKGKGRVWVKEESEEEELVESETRSHHRVLRRASIDADEIDRMFSDDDDMTPYTLEELMASSPQQPLSLNFNPGSSPLQARDQNRRATIPFSTPANLAKRMRTRQLAGPESTSSTPLSIGTLPEATYTLTTQRLQSSAARVPSSSRRSQVPSASRSHQIRHSSLESVNSEVPFPLSGTKASSMKAMMERHLKESPYAPPPGTKAAAAMASQHQLRSRKRRG